MTQIDPRLVPDPKTVSDAFVRALLDGPRGTRQRASACAGITQPVLGRWLRGGGVSKQHHATVEAIGESLGLAPSECWESVTGMSAQAPLSAPAGDAEAESCATE